MTVPAPVQLNLLCSKGEFISLLLYLSQSLAGSLPNNVRLIAVFSGFPRSLICITAFCLSRNLMPWFLGGLKWREKNNGGGDGKLTEGVPDMTTPVKMPFEHNKIWMGLLRREYIPKGPCQLDLSQRRRAVNIMSSGIRLTMAWPEYINDLLLQRAASIFYAYEMYTSDLDLLAVVCVLLAIKFEKNDPTITEPYMNWAFSTQPFKMIYKMELELLSTLGCIPPSPADFVFTVNPDMDFRVRVGKQLRYILTHLVISGIRPSEAAKVCLRAPMCKNMVIINE